MPNCSTQPLKTGAADALTDALYVAAGCMPKPLTIAVIRGFARTYSPLSDTTARRESALSKKH
jgi:hypothetical protein